MEPSDDMSSLMELVNSQLNEISIQMGPARNIASAVYETTGVQLPTPEFQFSLMSLNCGHSFKSDPVVAQQIANTIKAREIRQQEEANKAMIESAKAIKRENSISQPMEYLIDFKDAIIEQDNLKLEKIKQENPPIGKLDYALLNSNKVRPLFETSTKKSGNTRKTRLSTIGKVLCARYCPNPTIRTDPKIKYVLHVSPHLKGPSPDDIIKEKMKKEVRNFDVMSFYGLEPSTALQSSANKKKGVKGKKSQHKPNFNKTPQRDRIPPHHKK